MPVPVQEQEPAPLPTPVPTPVPTPAPARVPAEPAKIVFDLESQHEVFSPEETTEFTNPPAEEDLNDLQQKSQERRERLRRLSSEITNEAIKEKLEVPAYLRRNVALENVPHSSNRNISRFNLSDDNDILGDNKFLHDNVD